MDRQAFKIKKILIVLIGLCLGVVFWIFFRSELNENKLSLPMPKAAVKSLMALSKVRQTATKDGIVQWKLESATAELEAETGKMILQSPQIFFFLEDGSRIHMTATKGILYTKDNNMEVRGNVHLQNDRYILKTEQLAYHHAARIITTKTPVLIRGEIIELKAASMIYDLNTDQVEFNGPVKGIIYENPVS